MDVVDCALDELTSTGSRLVCYLEWSHSVYFGFSVWRQNFSSLVTLKFIHRLYILQNTLQVVLYF
jgi:hypothetical protein